MNDPRYQEVVDLFTASIPEDDGAQLSVFVKGQQVINTSTGVDPNSLISVFSCSKALSGVAFALIVQNGLLDLDEPVVTYWPEFGAKGKSKITVRQLLSHQAGLPNTRIGIKNSQWLTDHEAANLLAAERPLWAPGQAFGYHAVSLGTFISELAFRVTGRTIQEYFEENVRKPSGAQAFLGLPISEHHRVALVLPPKTPSAEQLKQFGPAENFVPGPYYAHVFGSLTPTEGPEVEYSFVGTRAMTFGHPAAGGLATAEGLARVFQWAVGYGEAESALTAETIEDFSQVQVSGFDLVLDANNSNVGTIFAKPSGPSPFGSISAFGHPGLAGALVFADPVGEIVFGYTVRRFTYPGGLDPRIRPIIKAIQAMALSGN